MATGKAREGSADMPLRHRNIVGWAERRFIGQSDVALNPAVPTRRLPRVARFQGRKGSKWA